MTGCWRLAEAELWRYRLERPVGGSGVASVDVVVVEIDDEDGRRGIGFTYALGGGGEAVCLAARRLLEQFVSGNTMSPPAALWRTMAASLGRIGRGESWLAVAAVDLAAWDLHAKRREVSLARALGGAPRAVPVYGSGGFTAGQTPEAAADCAKGHLARGRCGVKLRVSGTPDDAALLAAVADALPASAVLMVDGNEKCDPVSARRLAALCAEYGVAFLEEPLPADDVAGHAALARVSPVAIATGEHLQSGAEVLAFLNADACALLQPDHAMMGGVTGCTRAAHLAEEFGVPVAPHFLPGLFVHLAAAAPNLTLLEEFPLLEPLLEGWPEIDGDGRTAPPERPGHGLAWAAGARESFRIEV